MSDRVFRTDSDDNTFSPVVGQIPPLAMVAAITAADLHVTSTEQHCNKQDCVIRSDQVNILYGRFGSLVRKYWDCNSYVIVSRNPYIQI